MSPIGLRLDTHLSLSDDLRVRVRMPQSRDALALRALLHRLGLAAADLDLARVLRFDPAARTVVCATLWAGDAEHMVALAAFGADGTTDLLIADEHLTPGIGSALTAMLASDRARAAA